MWRMEQEEEVEEQGKSRDAENQPHQSFVVRYHHNYHLTMTFQVLASVCSSRRRFASELLLLLCTYTQLDGGLWAGVF